EDYRILLIGHRGHVEVEGTLGHAPERMLLVETVADVEALDLPADERSAAGREQVALFATSLVAGDRPGDVNEALMDLGSAICTAKEARCGICPLARPCRGRAAGNAAGIAAPKARKPARRIEVACAVVRRGDRVLFLRRPAEEALLGGMWELPTIEVAGDDDAGRRLAELVRHRSGLRVMLVPAVDGVRHEIVGRKIVAGAWCAEVSRAGRMPRDARMLAAAEAKEVALPALPVKILRALHRLGQPKWS
ncbi:MAG: NUDIX domain-containing protein, partial [Candidatus Binatia bacterium]